MKEGGSTTLNGGKVAQAGPCRQCSHHVVCTAGWLALPDESGQGWLLVVLLWDAHGRPSPSLCRLSQVNKLVGNRIMPKRIHVRLEHVNHSKCRQDFLDRVQNNERVKREARNAGITIPHTKRLPVQPRKAAFINGSSVETLTALKFYALYTQ